MDPGSERMPFTSIGWAPPGSAGRTVDPGFASARFARRPPKNRPNLSHVYMIIRGKGAKKSRILTRDLAAQIAARSLPSIYDYCL